MVTPTTTQQVNKEVWKAIAFTWATKATSPLSHEIEVCRQDVAEAGDKTELRNRKQQMLSEAIDEVKATADRMIEHELQVRSTGLRNGARQTTYPSTNERLPAEIQRILRHFEITHYTLLKLSLTVINITGRSNFNIHINFNIIITWHLHGIVSVILISLLCAWR